MAYEDRQSGSSSAALVILLLVVLLGGFLALAAGAWFFLRVSTFERQVVIEQDRAMAAAEEARWVQIEAEAQRAQLLAESDPNDAENGEVQRITIVIDENGNASMDGSPIQANELQSQLRAMSDESSGQLSVVIQADGRCRFEHVATVLSLCGEAGIESPRLTSPEE